MTDILDRARFRAAQTVAVGEDMGRLEAMPEGETLWTLAMDGMSDAVVLTPDGWLVYVNSGRASAYGRRVRATEELVRAIRGA